MTSTTLEKEELAKIFAANPREVVQLTNLEKKFFNFIFGQLMKANPRLKLHDTESGEGTITILKRKLAEL